jgi:hypothetical protein
MNTISKWLNKPVVINLASSGSIHGTLLEVDELWITLQLPKDKGLCVVPIYGVHQVCLGK